MAQCLSLGPWALDSRADRGCSRLSPQETIGSWIKVPANAANADNAAIITARAAPGSGRIARRDQQRHSVAGRSHWRIWSALSSGEGWRDNNIRSLLQAPRHCRLSPYRSPLARLALKNMNGPSHVPGQDPEPSTLLQIAVVPWTLVSRLCSGLCYVTLPLWRQDVPRHPLMNRKCKNNLLSPSDLIDTMKSTTRRSTVSSFEKD